MSRKMDKIELFFNKDHRIFMSLLHFLTWLLSIISLATLIATLIDCIENFYKLYGANITLIIAYISVKQYLNSNTMQILDFYYEKLVPTAHDTINYAKDKLSKKMTSDDLIQYLKNNENINFTNEELKNLEPKLYTDLLELHKTDLEFQTKTTLTLGYFESFSIKLTRGLVNYKLIEKASSKSFCVQVRDLYPLISLTRRENDKLYFTTMVNLFNKWKHVLNTTNQKE
jgi:hypothetical protein